MSTEDENADTKAVMSSVGADPVRMFDESSDVANEGMAEAGFLESDPTFIKSTVASTTR